MRGSTYVMQNTKVLLFLCLLRLPAILAYSSGAPLSACIDPSSTDIYYRASTGHNSNHRSTKTAWIEVYDVDDTDTKVSCVRQSKSYYVKLKANAYMKGILLGASRGIFPDMNTTLLRELSLEKVSHCPKTVTHNKVLFQTSEIRLPFITSSKRKGIEFRFAITFDQNDNLDNTLESFPLCPEEETVVPTPSISLSPPCISLSPTSSSQTTSIDAVRTASVSIPRPTLEPDSPRTISAASITCPDTCELIDGDRCSKESSTNNETKTAVDKDGNTYTCSSINNIRALKCEPSCVRELSCGSSCQLKCRTNTIQKERKFLCKPDSKDSSLKEFIKKFQVNVDTACVCEIA